MKRIIIYWIMCCICIASCSEPTALNKALTLSENNRSELEKVLSFYNTDKQKYKAAQFLIENMESSYSFEGEPMNNYYHLMDSIYCIPDFSFWGIRSAYDSIFKTWDSHNLSQYQDLKYIKANYLIKMIDEAFIAWQSPWAKDLSFEEFCEYVLPYRVGTEQLEDWKTDYREFYRNAFKHIDTQSDSALYQICHNLTQMYESHNYYYPAGMPSIKPSVLKYTKVAPCNDYVHMFTYIARTFGIPVAIDFTPQWANHSKGHEWSAVIHNGKSLDFMIGEGTPLHGHLRKFKQKLVKAYRKTSARQPSSLAMLEITEAIPPTFRNSRMKDVTKEYIPTIDLTVESLFDVADRGKYVYLCVFDDKNWVPVDWGARKRNKVVFSSIGYKAVFLPMYYINGNFVPAQYPIEVDDKGQKYLLHPDVQNIQRIVLKRKFMDYRAWEFVERIKGGRFQLSNNRLFKNVKEYFVPDTVGYNYQTWDVSDGHKYRYIRYIPSVKSGGDIAEIEVYEKGDKQIDGKVIGSYFSADEAHRRERAFDGKVLTYAFSVKEQADPWIGLDLGESKEVSKILYLPRSDDNFIKDKEKYECFYWDNKWVSLGCQIGDKKNQVLVYEKAPANAVFLLHNHTQGVEERIFMYKNGCQAWY